MRQSSRKAIDHATKGRDSLYYPEVSQKALEDAAARNGTCVRTPKPATVQKVMELDEPIGASDGMPSRWIMVENTSGEYHGRPITHTLYVKKLKHAVRCCTKE